MSRRGGFDQRLPLPVGGRNPTRRYRRFWLATGRDRLRLAVLAVGVLAAVLGGLLGARPPELAIEQTVGYYRIGSVTLPSQGDGVYSGPDGAVVVQKGPAETLAGGSTSLRGVPMKGSCTMEADGKSERCVFTSGTHTLRATDSRTSTGWHRRYDDGQTVDMALPSGPVPVPFPIGR
jgi:hypothetical protein